MCKVMAQLSLCRIIMLLNEKTQFFILFIFICLSDYKCGEKLRSYCLLSQVEEVALTASH